MTATPAPATVLLLDLTRRGIELEAHRDKLRYRPRSAMTPELAERITAHRGELLTILQEPRSADFEQSGPVRPVDADQRQTHRQEPGQPTRVPYLAECVATGCVSPGWTPSGWTARLRQLADCCEGVRPELAGEYHMWAENIESNGNSLA